jgi:tetratricopeptide (TPR) repeat protein
MSLLFRPRLIQALSAVIITASAGGPVLAEWGDSYHKAKTSLAAKDFMAAETAALEAVNASESFGETDSRRLDSLTVLGDCYREQRQWAAALQLYEQVQAALVKLKKADAPDAALLYEKIGVSAHKMRDYDKAQTNYETALKIRRQRYKQNVAEIATIVTNLGELYRRKKEWDKAEVLHDNAIKDKENELGPEHPSLVASFNNLALVFKEQKRYDEAMKLLDRAEKLALKGENAGKNNDRATALHNLGDVYAAQSKHKEARAAYEQALAIREELLGKEHPYVGETLASLGNSLLGLNLGDEALAVYDRVIGIYKNEYGASDSKTTRVLSAKAMALDRLKRHDEAKALREEVKALEEKRKNNP